MNDVERACFYTEVRRPVSAEMPKEDDALGEGRSTIGKLNLSMYGTIEAALK